MFEIPLAGGAQCALEADEKWTFAVVGEFSEAFDGGVLDIFVPCETDESGAAWIANFEDGVVRKILAAGAGVVELEAVFEKHFVEYSLLAVGVEGEEKCGFLLFDISTQRSDVFGFVRSGIGLELATWKVGFLQTIDFKARVGNRLRVGAIALDDAVCSLDSNIADYTEALSMCGTGRFNDFRKLYADKFSCSTVFFILLDYCLTGCPASCKEV